MCELFSIISAIVGTAATIGGAVVSNNQQKKAQGKAWEQQQSLLQEQRRIAQEEEVKQRQANALVDRNQPTAEKLKDNASTPVKRDMNKLLVPLLQTQGTGMNTASSLGTGLNLGGNG